MTWCRARRTFRIPSPLIPAAILYIINAPVYVGGPNQPDHGHRTAHLVIRNGGTMTLLGNLPDHMTVFLGNKANGSLEINGRPPSDGPGPHSGLQRAWKAESP